MKKELSTGKIILLAVLAILLAIALTLALIDLVRNVLAGPITGLFYLFELLLNSTPQVLFWGMLLLFFLIVAGKSMQQVHRPQPTPFARPVRFSKRERVAFWAYRVNRALRGDQYSYSRLIEFLAGLALDVDAQEERLSLSTIRQHLESGELGLPPEIENYLRARLDTGYLPDPSFWQRVKERLARIWNSFSANRNQAPGAFGGSLTQAELEKIIQYLEDRLEV